MILISGKDLRHLKAELSQLAANQEQLAQGGMGLAEVQRSQLKILVMLCFMLGVLIFVSLKKQRTLFF